MDEHIRILRFVLFTTMFIGSIPFLRKSAANPDLEPGLDPSVAEWIAHPRIFKGLLEAPEHFHRFYLGLMVSRLVDNLHTYIAEALLGVFEVRPETLRSGTKVEVREVLECASIEEFAARLAERRVEELSHEGFAPEQRYLVGKLGVDLEFDEEDLRLVSEATAIRNLVVHNRGYVNQRFLRDTRREDLRVGDLLKLEMETVERYNKALHNIANTVDRGLLRKFGLPLFFATAKESNSPAE